MNVILYLTVLCLAICVVSSQPYGGTTKNGSDCVFPFLYRGKTYDTCTYADRFQSWCAITPNFDQDKQWGLCLRGTRPPRNIMKCDFEDGDICMFHQVQSDDFDWSVGEGTPTVGTGPQSGANLTSKFAFIETTNKTPKMAAKITTPYFIPGNYFISFYYNAFGNSMGTLEMNLVDTAQRSTKLWSKVINGVGNDTEWQRVTNILYSEHRFQIEFSGKRGYGDSGDFAIDEFWLGIEPNEYIHLNKEPYKCDFSYGSMCGIEQDYFPWDTMDWTLKKGSTDTQNTGPSAGHTSVDNSSSAVGDYYMYLECGNFINTVAAGSKAILRTPVLVSPSSCIKVSFWYHAYGGSLDSLSVKYGNLFPDTLKAKHYAYNGTSISEDAWKYASTIIYEREVVISFEATVGTGSFRAGGDYAIDDIIISDCTTGVELYEPITLSFGDGSVTPLLQDYSDDFDWSVRSDSTSTERTGPSKGHTCLADCAKDYYAYIETSSPRESGDTALIYTPEYYFTASGCIEVSLWYHGYGRDLGSLKIMYADPHSNWNESWVAPSVSENAWKFVKIQIHHNSSKIGIQGTRGNGNTGDYAVDDITITDCAYVPPTTPSPEVTGQSSTGDRTVYRYYTGGRIQSPNYPQNYDNYANISWVILVQPGMTIQLDFERIQTQAITDELNVYDLRDQNRAYLIAYSGRLESRPSYDTGSNHVELNFTSDGQLTDEGFSLRWHLLDSNGNPVPQTNNVPGSGDGLSVGAIVGIVAGVLCVVAMIAVIVFCCCRRASSTKKNNGDSEAHTPMQQEHRV